ncbi:MAG: hypothetical protein IJT49_00555 [Clostridia bacterium]|nr:hypothetical protein [Clostridia bacterium]
MRKNKDYSDIENVLSEKANKIEKGINYSGAVRDSKNVEGEKERGKEKRSYGFPGRQLVAAAVAMVLVGAGTFGTLKYLEHLGAQRIAEHGGSYSQDNNNAAYGETSDDNNAYAESVADVVVDPVEYDPKYDSFIGQYVYVKSGDNVFSPFIYPLTGMAVIDYQAPTLTYSGKLQLVNNVKDKDFTVLMANIVFDGVMSFDGEFKTTHIDELFDFIENSAYSWYEITAELTWDDPSRSDAKVYYVDFYVQKNEASGKFDDVVKFDIDFTDNGDALKLDLPLEHNYANVHKVECDAAKALGYSIYWYDSAPAEVSMIYYSVCIIDENSGEVVFDRTWPGAPGLPVNEIWYAGQTPSGHPTLFYMTSHTLRIGWTYADLYSYDLITHDQFLVISVGPKSIMSMSNIYVYGELSYEDKTITARFYEAPRTDIWSPDDKETWPEPFAVEPIQCDGGQYYVDGIDPVRYPVDPEAETENDNDVKQIVEEASYRISVISGDTMEYPPLISAHIDDENGGKQIKTGNGPIEIEYAEPFTVKNEIRTLMTIDDISVNGASLTMKTDSLAEYLHGLYESIDEVKYMEITVSAHWENENVYEYGFLLRMIPEYRPATENENTVEITEGPSEPDPALSIDHSAQIEELQSWLSQRMWEGMTEEELLNMAVEEKGLKNAILASVPEQINQEDDGTFIRYKTEYCDFLYFAEKDTLKIREAMMILHPGTNFALPFGITLDMSPAEALNALGYTQEQITAMDGYACSGAYELRYNDRFLTLTYHCNGAVVGIELGPESQMYMETAE